jgi:hypothetical protein
MTIFCYYQMANKEENIKCKQAQDSTLLIEKRGKY